MEGCTEGWPDERTEGRMDGGMDRKGTCAQAKAASYGRDTQVP